MINITSESDTITITCFTALVWVPLTLVIPLKDVPMVLLTFSALWSLIQKRAFDYSFNC